MFRGCPKFQGVFFLFFLSFFFLVGGGGGRAGGQFLCLEEI